MKNSKNHEKYKNNEKFQIHTVNIGLGTTYS